MGLSGPGSLAFCIATPFLDVISDILQSQQPPGERGRVRCGAVRHRSPLGARPQLARYFCRTGIPVSQRSTVPQNRYDGKTIYVISTGQIWPEDQPAEEVARLEFHLPIDTQRHREKHPPRNRKGTQRFAYQHD